MAKYYTKKNLDKKTFLFLHPDPEKIGRAISFLSTFKLMRKLFTPTELASVLGYSVKNKKDAKTKMELAFIQSAVDKIESEGWGLAARSIVRGETKKVNKFEKSVTAYLKSKAKGKTNE